jgi:integrase
LSTDRQIKTAAAGRHTVAGVKGLLLEVTPRGSRSWVLRVQRNGKRHDLGLGPYPEITLAAARDKALERRRAILAGAAPLAHRQAPKALTFQTAAEALIESKRPGWRNAKHAAQWGATLATYANPLIGARDVRAVDTADVVAVLTPIWTAKTETASRLRQRIEAVLDYASALGIRSGDNPARWRGHLDHLLAAPTKVRAVEHHSALPWAEAPAFVAELATRPGIAAKALLFAILTAARSGEVRGATWAEIDVAGATWTVPAGRIKAGREHRVPLPAAALELLGEPGPASALLFPPPRNPSRPLTDPTLTKVLERMGRGDLTAHGFRSTFRDWAGETTAHPREVIEAALAHRLKDKAEAAYARGDLFQKRRRLMEDWAAFLARPAAEVARLAAPVSAATA